MIPLNSLYNQIIESLGMTASADGLLSRMNSSGENELCMVSGKRLALAIPAILNRSPWDTIVAFHPLSEGANRQESVVQKKLRFLVKTRLQEVITVLWGSLIAISADSDNHKNLTPGQIAFLKAVPEADARMVKAINALGAEIDVLGEKTLINIYPKRASKIGAKSFTRAALVTFPILKDLNRLEPDINADTAKQEYTVYGAKMRKKDKEAIRNLFNAILPHADDSDTYSGGSNSMVAPSFDALMRAYYNVGSRLNEITELFGNQLGDRAIHLDLGWIRKMDTLEVFRDMLPTPLPGNDGEPIKGMVDETQTIDLKPAPQRQNQPTPQQPQPAAPVGGVVLLPPGGHVQREQLQAESNSVASFENSIMQYQYEQQLRQQGGWMVPGMYTAPNTNAPPAPFARFVGTEQPVAAQQPQSGMMSDPGMLGAAAQPSSWSGGI